MDRSDPDQRYTDWKRDGTPDALRGVVDALDPTISSAMKSYAQQSADSPVLRQHARLMAADAVRSFTPGGEAKLTSYVHSQLQTLRREAPRLYDPMPKPERLAIETAQISKKQQALSDHLGREPSFEELADYGNYDIKKLRKAMSRNRAVVPESSVMGENFDTGEEDEIMPGVSSKTPQAVWADYVYHDLNDVDKVVFQYRTGYRGAEVLSNLEIARRLRLTPSAVSQRVARLQAKMNQLNGAGS